MRPLCVGWGGTIRWGCKHLQDLAFGICPQHVLSSTDVVTAMFMLGKYMQKLQFCIRAPTNPDAHNKALQH